MRDQLKVLEHLVRMWDLDKNNFWIGVHTLTINVEDIYFLIGLSKKGAQVSLFGSKASGETIGDFIVKYSYVGTRKRSGNIPIKNVRDVPLKTIIFIITCISESVTLHLATKAQIQYALECMEPIIFNWCEGSWSTWNINDWVQDRSTEMVQLWIDFGILFLERVLMMHPQVDKNDLALWDPHIWDGSSCWHATRMVRNSHMDPQSSGCWRVSWSWLRISLMQAWMSEYI